MKPKPCYCTGCEAAVLLQGSAAPATRTLLVGPTSSPCHKFNPWDSSGAAQARRYRHLNCSHRPPGHSSVIPSSQASPDPCASRSQPCPEGWCRVPVPRHGASHQAGHGSPLSGWRHSWTEEPSGQVESLGFAGKSWSFWLQAGWCHRPRYLWEMRDSQTR